ncbi:MAG TPA: hypothetical protein VFO16_19045 [Pseudonocardiaceae bacterium]|nr:hypothetical protein [Pseudonocardiaceae bacterium]
MAPVSRLRLSQRREAAGSAPPLGVPSELWLDRAQFQDLARPQDEKAVTTAAGGSLEPVRPAEVAVFACPAPASAPAPAAADSGAIAGPGMPPPQVEAENQPTLVAHPARKQRLTGWAVACGVAAVVAGCAAWAVFAGSSGESAPAVTNGTSTLTAPMASLPPPSVPQPAAVPPDAPPAEASHSAEDPAGAPQTASAVTPVKPAVSESRSAPAVVPDTHRAQSGGQVVRQPTPPAFVPPSSPRGPMTPEEAYMQWSRQHPGHSGTRWNPFGNDDPSWSYR